MSHAGAVFGGLVVFALLLIKPIVGLVAIAAVLLVAAGLWLTRTDSSRPCPRCGERVENGVLDCPHCAFDFRTIGAA